MALDSILQRFFIKYTPILIRRWYIFVILPVVCTGLLSFGLFRLKELKNTDPNYVHSPINAPSKWEKEVLNELWPLDVDEFLPQRSFNYKSFFVVLVTVAGCSRGSKGIPECNLLSPEPVPGTANQTYLQLLESLDTNIVENVTVRHRNGTVYNYEDLCLSWWDSCVRSSTILKMLTNQKKLKDNGILVTYPRANTQATPIYLAYNLGGVITNPKTEEINFVTAIRLNYFLRTEDHVEDDLAKNWESEAAKFLSGISGPKKYLHMSVYYSSALEKGLQKQNEEVVPKFAIAIALLIFFSTCCCLKSSKKGSWMPRIDWVRSKTTMALVGIVTAGMGIASGFGFSLLCGVPHSGVTVVVPFLIISIGVDDMFIILNAWHHLHSQRLSMHDRMAATLKEAAVSITITSITDALSFAIGCSTRIPSVQWFCFYATFCIVFNYLYQITFFVGWLVVFGRMELDNKNSVFPCILQKSPQVSQANGAVENGFATEISNKTNNNSNGALTEKIVNDANEEKPNVHICRKYYGPFLLNTFTQAFVCVALVVYLGVSITGCQYLREGLEYSDLLLRTDPTIEYIDTASEYFNEGWQCEVVIANAPDLSNPHTRRQILNMVEDFEQSTYAMGRNSTQFWLRNYLAYLNETQTYIQNTRHQWVNGVYNFVNRFSFQKTWKQDVAWNNQFDAKTREIKGFRFRLGLSFDFSDPDNQRDAVVRLRHIADKYKQWRVSTYGGYFWDQVDQYLIVKPNTLQNVGIALVTMVVISLSLIPSPICTLWITLTIISIDLGVVGFMTWWDVNLDPISMITIIMSIGFSVDFAAHITYGYVSHPDPHADPRERTISSLERLGYPLFQAAVSSVLGVSILATVNSEMVLIFLKTVVLVIVFGVIHALVFLPVLLNLTMPYLQRTHSTQSVKKLDEK